VLECRGQVVVVADRHDGVEQPAKLSWAGVRRHTRRLRRPATGRITDIADAAIEGFILETVERLSRLPTARPMSPVISVGPDASEERYTATCSPFWASSAPSRVARSPQNAERDTRNFRPRQEIM